MITCVVTGHIIASTAIITSYRYTIRGKDASSAVYFALKPDYGAYRRCTIPLSPVYSFKRTLMKKFFSLSTHARITLVLTIICGAVIAVVTIVQMTLLSQIVDQAFLAHRDLAL